MSRAAAEAIGSWAWVSGWRGTDLAVSIAVAMATGGDPARAGGLYGIGGGGDGPSQANAAYAKWKTNGWTDFPTHQSRGYLLFMPQATVAAGIVSSVGPPTQTAVEAGQAAAGAVSSAVDNVSGVVDNATSIVEEPLAVLRFLTLPQTWQRIAKIGGGFILVAVGTFLLTQSTIWAASKSVGKVAGSVVGVRKGAALAKKAVT